jgi:hypothetical protein
LSRQHTRPDLLRPPWAPLFVCMPHLGTAAAPSARRRGGGGPFLGRRLLRCAAPFACRLCPLAAAAGFSSARPAMHCVRSPEKNKLPPTPPTYPFLAPRSCPSRVFAFEHFLCAPAAPLRREGVAGAAARPTAIVPALVLPSAWQQAERMSPCCARLPPDIPLCKHCSHHCCVRVCHGQACSSTLAAHTPSVNSGPSWPTMI